jgi:hypothetical protein
MREYLYQYYRLEIENAIRKDLVVGHLIPPYQSAELRVILSPYGPHSVPISRLNKENLELFHTAAPSRHFIPWVYF